MSGPGVVKRETSPGLILSSSTPQNWAWTCFAFCQKSLQPTRVASLIAACEPGAKMELIVAVVAS
jgi:hypothetical protein